MIRAVFFIVGGAILGGVIGSVVFHGFPSTDFWVWTGAALGVVLLFVVSFSGLGGQFTWIARPLRILTIGAPRIRHDASARARQALDPSNSVTLLPHQQLDAARPFQPDASRNGAPIGARAGLALLLLALAGGAVWVNQSFALTSPVAVPWVLALLLFLHRADFRRRIASANEPYTGKASDYPSKLWSGIKGADLPSTIFALSVVAVVCVDLLTTAFGGHSPLFRSTALVVLMVTFGSGTISAGHLARRYVPRSRTDYELKRIMQGEAGIIPLILGVRADLLLITNAVSYSGHEIYVTPPPHVAPNYRSIEGNLLNHHIDAWMLASDSTPERIHLTAADEATRERSRWFQLTRGLVVGVAERPHPLPDHAPERIVTLAPGFDTKHLPLLQEFAAEPGDNGGLYTVVQVDLTSATPTAVLTPVKSYEAQIYQRTAALLKVPVWDLYMIVTWANVGTPDVRPDEVLVFDAPVRGLIPEQRHETWRAIISAMPKASNGWEIDDDQKTGKVSLRYGEPLSLPDTFMLKDTAPQSVTPERWSSIPLGVNSKGKVISINLEKTPHLLIAGGTGSGKSTLLSTDMSGRLLRGHDIVTIDTAKGGNDFLTLKPWNIMWGETITEAASILAMIYEESIRRRGYLKRFRVGSWTKLTPEQLDEGSIRPLSIFYDEYENSVVDKTVPKNLPKDHPIVLSAMSHNASVDFVRHYMPQLAKEARSVGIFLVVATQTPHSARIGEALRANLGGVIQLSGGKLESHIVRLTMGEATGLAMEQFEMFNKPKLDTDGREKVDEDGNPIMLPGLAVILRDGGQPTAMRVAYSPEDGRPAILAGSNIPPVQPWRITDVLDIDLKRTIDEDDTREPISPPFSLMTHLGDADVPETRSVAASLAVSPEDDPVTEPSVTRQRDGGATAATKIDWSRVR